MMNLLILHTSWPQTVAALVSSHQLIPGRNLLPGGQGEVIYRYPDDVLSQELTFWLTMAQGCGLIESYSFGRKAV